MIELAQKLGTRDSLRVLKLRGNNYQEGLRVPNHPSGLDVFPRLTSPTLPPTRSTRSACHWVVGLDKMLGGGSGQGRNPRRRRVGREGTRLAVHSRGAATRRPGLYVNFQENPIQLARTIQSLGVDPEEAKRKGLHLLYASPVELQIDSILVTLFRTIEERQISVWPWMLSTSHRRATDLTRLYNYLHVQRAVVRRIANMMTLGRGLVATRWRPIGVSRT
jgi:circadian clock protein KaiC